MAATDVGRRLTEAHRVAQARLGAQTVAQMLQVWPLLDLSALDVSAGRWLTAAEAIVTTQRRTSSALAGRYLSAFRTAEIGGTPPPPVPSPVDPQALRTSLIVTGPVKVKSALSAGRDISTASDIASATSAAAGQRHALNGGRDALQATDPDVKGWARVTSPGCCHFCALLASRGPVYHGDDFQAHDSCSCTLEPVYAGDGWPPRSREFSDLYDQVRRDIGYDANATDTRNAFRRALEAQRT